MKFLKGGAKNPFPMADIYDGGPCAIAKCRKIWQMTDDSYKNEKTGWKEGNVKNILYYIYYYINIIIYVI